MQTVGMCLAVYSVSIVAMLNFKSSYLTVTPQPIEDLKPA